MIFVKRLFKIDYHHIKKNLIKSETKGMSESYWYDISCYVFILKAHDLDLRGLSHRLLKPLWVSVITTLTSVLTKHSIKIKRAFSTSKNNFYNEIWTCKSCRTFSNFKRIYWNKLSLRLNVGGRAQLPAGNCSDRPQRTRNCEFE